MGNHAAGACVKRWRPAVKEEIKYVNVYAQQARCTQIRKAAACRRAYNAYVAGRRKGENLGSVFVMHGTYGVCVAYNAYTRKAGTNHQKKITRRRLANPNQERWQVYYR